MTGSVCLTTTGGGTMVQVHVEIVKDTRILRSQLEQIRLRPDCCLEIAMADEVARVVKFIIGEYLSVEHDPLPKILSELR